MISGSFAYRDDDVGLVIATRLRVAADRADASLSTKRRRRYCPEGCELELAPWRPGVVRCPWCGHEEAAS